MKKLHKKTAYILLIILIMVASFFLLWPFNTPKGNNVVLIVSDALRKDMLGCYAGNAKTPNIDWLAKNGVLFENAYTTSPSTIFSATSLLTGNYPTSYGNKPIQELQWDFPLVFDVELLPAELLGKTGYDVKMDIENPLIGWIAQGFEKIQTYDELTSNQKGNVQRIIPIKAEADCYKLLYGFLNYLLTGTNDRFFVLKWILDPHSPYNPPKKFKQEIQVDLSQLPQKRNFYSNNKLFNGNYNEIEKRYLRDLYTKEVESVDQRLGYVLKALEYRALLQDTYVVFTADHGELFGEHGEWSHGQNYYEELVHIPLIIAGPGIAKGKRVSTVVSNVDIMKTLLDLLGVEFQYKSQGKSFKKLLAWNPLQHLLFSINNNNSAYFECAYGGGTHKDAIRENHYKLICCRDNTYELYNLLDDPNETTNLATNNPKIVQKCLVGLTETRTKNIMLRESRTQVGESMPVNTELVDQLKALGYVGSQEHGEKEDEHDVIINAQNVWLEAEYADTLISPFEIATDENAANGKFIFAPDGTGDEYDPGSSIMATYTVNISQPGIYFLWGRVMVRDGLANSFFVQMDDNPENLWDIEFGNYWHWDKVNNNNLSDPARFSLSAGLHTIKVKLQEDGTKLDKLLLTNAMGSIPAGKGDAVQKPDYSDKN